MSEPIRIAILSDLHLDTEKDDALRFGVRGWGAAARADNADLVLLAGDIHNGIDGIAWAAREFDGLPVCMCHGNHEYHGHDLNMLIRQSREAAAVTSNVRFLEDEKAVITIRDRNVHVFGCTLWTDWEINARRGPDGSVVAEDVNRAQFEAARCMGDFEEISRSMGGRFMPHHAAAIHARSLSWLDRYLGEVRGNDLSIVLTHHAPSPRSIPPWRHGDLLNAAFASDLETFVTWHQPDLLVHGHIHDECDFDLGHTRVLSHPRGYPKDADSAWKPKIVQI